MARHPIKRCAIQNLFSRALVSLLLISCSGAVWAQDSRYVISEHARQLHKQAIVIDTHVDTTERLLLKGYNLAERHNDGAVDIPRMREGGLDGVFFSIWTPGTRPGPEALKSALIQIDAVRQVVKANSKDLVLATTADEVRAAHKEGKIAILLGLEGGHMIANDLGVLRILASLGIRYVTLTHTDSIDWAGSSGDKFSARGLNDFGRQVIAELNRLGVMVDVSHVSDQTFDDVLAVSQAPVIASHSSMRAIDNHPRNLTDDMLRRLAAKGGVVQITYLRDYLSQELNDAMKTMTPVFQEYRQQIQKECGDNDECRFGAMDRFRDKLVAEGKLPAVSWEKIVEHIDHAVKVVGVGHVGLGSDFDGGGMPKGMEDVSHLPQITEALIRKGYSDEDIKKILGRNILCVMEQINQVGKQLRAQ